LGRVRRADLPRRHDAPPPGDPGGRAPAAGGGGGSPAGAGSGCGGGGAEGRGAGGGGGWRRRPWRGRAAEAAVPDGPAQQDPHGAGRARPADAAVGRRRAGVLRAAGPPGVRQGQQDRQLAPHPVQAGHRPPPRRRRSAGGGDGERGGELLERLLFRGPEGGRGGGGEGKKQRCRSLWASGGAHGRARRRRGRLDHVGRRSGGAAAATAADGRVGVLLPVLPAARGDDEMQQRRSAKVISCMVCEHIRSKLCKA
jgi:hypothetical protein